MSTLSMQVVSDPILSIPSTMNVAIHDTLEDRLAFIRNELNTIFLATQDYLLKNMIAEDLDTELKKALQKAARNLCYRKKTYNKNKKDFVYFPTCKKLIENCDLMTEAEKYFYSGTEQIPQEYSEALRAAVSAIRSREKSRSTNNKIYMNNIDFLHDSIDDTETESNSGDDETQSLIDHNHSKMAEKVGGSWRNSMNDSLDYRMSLA